MTTSTTSTSTSTDALGALTICHDYDGGTTVVGTTKDSPAHHAIKANGSWTWSRYAGAWLLRSSRHRRPKYGEIDLIERTLTARGYAVTREIDETMPPIEQQEADLAGRMDDRADRLSERAGAKAAAAAATRAKADAVFNNIPFGQPTMPDHHSYNADVNRRERARNNLGKAIDLAGYASELGRRAGTAAAHMGARHSPVTVGNRIEKLQAERRGVQRRIDGERAWESYTDEHGRPSERLVKRPAQGEYRDKLLTDVAELDERIGYWEGVYRELQAEGKASTAGPDTVAKGDFVLVRGHWYRARRVNKKSVSVPSIIIAAPQPGEREYTDTTPWHEVRGHRTTEQMPAAFVDAYETPGANRLRLDPAEFPSDAEDTVGPDGMP